MAKIILITITLIVLTIVLIYGNIIMKNNGVNIFIHFMTCILPVKKYVI